MGDIRGARQVRRSQGLLISEKLVCHHTMDKTIDSYLVLEQNSFKINEHLHEKSLRIFTKAKHMKGNGIGPLTIYCSK